MVNTELHVDILPEQQRKLFDILAEQAWIDSFYLAGGTALALHIGHRQSLDFDFFTEREFRNRDIIEQLQSIGSFELFSEAEYTLYGLLNDVRISFFRYQYPLLHEFRSYRHLAVVDMLDIALMKLEAISGRESKKDFIDLYFLLKYFSLEELFEQYETKYGIAVSNHYHLLKSLAYFEDAESQPMPVMYADVTWEHIKESIISVMKQGKFSDMRL